MRKCVMDDFRILRKLKKLALKAIDVLDKSRGTCSCYEAGKMRRDLQETLDKKEEKSENAFMDELISVLEEVAEFFKDYKRSFKSEDFKKLGNKISGFLEAVENASKNITRR